MPTNLVAVEKKPQIPKAAFLSCLLLDVEGSTGGLSPGCPTLKMSPSRWCLGKSPGREESGAAAAGVPLPISPWVSWQQAGISHLGEGDIFFAVFPRLKAGISPQEEAGIYKAGHWHFIHCYHPVIQTRSLSRKGQLGLCCSLLLFFPFFSFPLRERGKSKAKARTRTADCHFSYLKIEGLLYYIEAKTFQSPSCKGGFCKVSIVLLRVPKMKGKAQCWGGTSVCSSAMPVLTIALAILHHPCPWSEELS